MTNSPTAEPALNGPGTASDGLRARVLNGLAWKAGSQVLLQIARFAVAIVLARLLAPEEWGIAAMVLVVRARSSSSAKRSRHRVDSTARHHRRGPVDRVLDRDRCRGGADRAGIALAGPLAHFYDEPKVKPLFAVLSLSFVVAALGTTQSALLLRDMDYRRLELRRIAAGIVSSAIAIALPLRASVRGRSSGSRSPTRAARQP